MFEDTLGECCPNTTVVCRFNPNIKNDFQYQLERELDSVLSTNIKR